MKEVDIMEYKEGLIKNSFEVGMYALDLHYDLWDSQGREESNIQERIEENDNYILKYINISDIIEPYTIIFEDKIEEYMEMDINTMPPIVLTMINNKYEIIDGGHRYIIIKNKNIKKVLAFIPYVN